MIKLSKRLTAIANLVDNTKVMADVGCDHALLDIYLLLNKKIKRSYACDVLDTALDQARKNIKKYNVSNIELVLSDGLDKIKDEYMVNTIVISGLGSNKIFDILGKSKLKNINSIIIQSNNDSRAIRNYLVNNGYFIDKDVLVKENDIIYIITRFVRNDRKNTKFEINNLKMDEENTKLYKEYVNNIIKKNNYILKNIPNKKILKRIKLGIQNYKLKKMINI